MNILERLNLNIQLSETIYQLSLETDSQRLILLTTRLDSLRENLGLEKRDNEQLKIISPKNTENTVIFGQEEISVENLPNIELPAKFSRNEVTKVLTTWLKSNLQGKHITTADGKKVFFNAIQSSKHLIHDGRIGEIEAKAIKYIAEVFKTGNALGRQELTKPRQDFVAFHAYQKTVIIDNLKCLLEAKAGEREDGRLEMLPTLIAYSQRVYDKINTTAEPNKEDTLQQVIVQDDASAFQSIVSENTQAGKLTSNALLMDNIAETTNNQGELATLTILSITDLKENPTTFDEIKQQAFNYNADKVTASQRTKANYEALAILEDITTGKLSEKDLTAEQKITLSEYSGWGGGLKRPDGVKGSPYEYYTPKAIAQGMWDLLAEMGFNGGVVLDPCAGTGIFSATAPENTLIQSIELDTTSGRINQAIFANDENKNIQISPFESVAKSSEDESVDAVITNVPFGDNRGGNQFKDDRYQNMSLEGYFILRSLDKLRPNGLAVFMSSTGVMSGLGSRNQEIRRLASLKAEFRGAYRLPNKLFASAGADVVTDVIVFKKHSRNNRLLIEDLSQTNLEKLTQANVLWETFISGQYFKQEGKRYILGKEQQGTGRFGDVVRVINDDSIGNIAKLLRRFGDSRIDWELLESTEEPPIQYQQGDQVYFAGVLKEFKNGLWVNAEIGKQTDYLNLVKQSLEEYRDPIEVVENKLSIQTLMENLCLLTKYQLMLADIPNYIKDYHHIHRKTEVEAIDVAELDLFVTTCAYKQVNELNAHRENFAYATAYPELSKQIKQIVLSKAKMPSWFNRVNVHTVFKKMKLANAVFNPKTNSFSNIWLGTQTQLQAIEIEQLSDFQRYESLLYGRGADFSLNGGIPKQQFSEVFPHIDLNDTQDWCISLDGKNVIAANDYYHGNYQQFEQAHLEAIANCQDIELKARLNKQLEQAQSRVIKADISKFQFDINSPLIPLEYKVKFLNQHFTGYAGRYSIENNSKGEPRVVYKDSSQLYGKPKEQAAVYKRLANYVNTDSFSAGVSDKQTAEYRLTLLKQMIKSANIQFNLYVNEDQNLIQQIEQQINDPSALMFRQTENGDALSVQGINPEFKPRPHQAAYIRQQARHMGGICGFDVGLGKTATALISVQHLQSIGAKKKTIFCVPNTTLTNWQKEAKSIYQPEVFERCLFVGVREGKNGKLSIQNKAVKEDIQTILNHKHNKIFMSMESFISIILRDQTIEDYVDYLTYEPTAGKNPFHLAAIVERNKTRALKLKKDISKTMKADTDYLEKMGIDSLVIDEAHHFKNAKSGEGYGRRVKWLSISEPSARGLNASVKSWYIRDGNTKNDGVLCLTATPITNSPLEIYSMLTLAIGDDKVNKLTGCRGAKDFLMTFCDIDFREEKTVDDNEKQQEVFAGLKNLDVLRKLISSSTTIKSAEDLPNSESYIPGMEEINCNISLCADVIEKIDRLKEIYQRARSKNPHNDKLLSQVMEEQGETKSTLAHPFNFINKISKLLLDEDLSDETSRYFINEKDKALAEKVINQFNQQANTEERINLIGLKEEDILKQWLGDEEKGEAEKILKVAVKARLENNQISLNTVDFSLQSKFIALAEKAGLALNVKTSAKMSVLLDNVNRERANPKARGRRCKQIIFCDMLGSHHKIKLMLAEKANIPPAKMMILNAQAVSDQAKMQEIQDGFNADGEENQYEIIIANKKAEVGINLQKGTQAIHHLTTGWTPDSLQQRNGRGVRQGNYLAEQGMAVNVYQYDANGTFDSYKRHLINNKANWIESLLKDGGDRVAIEQGLTLKQQELLAEAVGNEQQTEQLLAEFNQENQAKALKAQRENFSQQLEQLKFLNKNLDSISSQSDFVKLEHSKIQPLLDNVLNAFSSYEEFKQKEEQLKLQIEELKKDKANNATLASKEKSLMANTKRIERAWGLYVYQWESLISAPNPLIALLELPKQPPADKLKELLRLASNTLHNFRFKGEDEKSQQVQALWQQQLETKQKSFEKAKVDLIKQGERANISQGRIKLAQQQNAAFLNGFPLKKGDFFTYRGGLNYFVNYHAHSDIAEYIPVSETGEIADIKARTHRGFNTISWVSITDKETFIEEDSPQAQNIYQKMAEIDQATLESGNERISLWQEHIRQVTKYVDSSTKEILHLSQDEYYTYEGGLFNKIITPSLWGFLQYKQLEIGELIKDEYQRLGIEYQYSNYDGKYSIYVPVSLNAKEATGETFSIDDLKKLNEQLTSNG